VPIEEEEEEEEEELIPVSRPILKNERAKTD
jgi:hypothetical protein